MNKRPGKQNWASNRTPRNTKLEKPLFRLKSTNLNRLSFIFQIQTDHLRAGFFSTGYDTAEAAATYHGLDEFIQYEGPEIMANMLAGLIPDIVHAKILDLAAGPGKKIPHLSLSVPDCLN